MSSQVQTAFANMYSANVQMLVQQKGSRFRDAVRQEHINGEIAYFDQVGAGTAMKPCRVMRIRRSPKRRIPAAR